MNEKKLWDDSIVIPNAVFQPVQIVLNEEQETIKNAFVEHEMEKAKEKIRARIIVAYIEACHYPVFCKIQNFFIGERKSLKECADILYRKYGVPCRVIAAFRILFNKE